MVSGATKPYLKEYSATIAAQKDSQDRVTSHSFEFSQLTGWNIISSSKLLKSDFLDVFLSYQ